MSESTGTLGLDRELKAKHRQCGGSVTIRRWRRRSSRNSDLYWCVNAACRKEIGCSTSRRGPATPPFRRLRWGAQVIATDLAPELFVAGREAAALAGVELDWQEADAEALPFGDNEFDVVLSCVGVMFAPHHQRAADELLRVCRPGGKIGVLSWTPTGFIGEMFKTMKPYAPPPPPGSQPAPLWGDENHVRDLLGDVAARKDVLRVDTFSGPEDFRDFFKKNYGPTIAVYRNIADDPDRTQALDRDLLELAKNYGSGSEPFVMEWEYLLLTATPDEGGA